MYQVHVSFAGIRIAIIAHGDYCDADTYIVQWIDFGASLPELCDFVENVRSTGGGDGPECYELVLKRAREELAWTRGSKRVLVVIGDDEPHPVGYTYGGQTYNIDWKEECELLKQMVQFIYISVSFLLIFFIISLSLTAFYNSFISAQFAF